MNSGNYFLARVVKFLDKKFLTIIFNSLILSHVIYNKSIILNVTCYLRNKLQSKLHNAESIIDNKLKKYCIKNEFNVNIITKKYLLLQIHKMIYNGDLNDAIIGLIIGKTSERTRNLKCIAYKKSISKRNFEIYIPKIWNSLPQKVKKIEKFTDFRKTLDSYFTV